MSSTASNLEAASTEEAKPITFGELLRDYLKYGGALIGMLWELTGLMLGHLNYKLQPARDWLRARWTRFRERHQKLVWGCSGAFVALYIAAFWFLFYEGRRDPHGPPSLAFDVAACIVMTLPIAIVLGVAVGLLADILKGICWLRENAPRIACTLLAVKMVWLTTDGILASLAPEEATSPEEWRALFQRSIADYEDRRHRAILAFCERRFGAVKADDTQAPGPVNETVFPVELEAEDAVTDSQLG